MRAPPSESRDRSRAGGHDHAEPDGGRRCGAAGADRRGITRVGDGGWARGVQERCETRTEVPFGALHVAAPHRFLVGELGGVRHADLHLAARASACGHREITSPRRRLASAATPSQNRSTGAAHEVTPQERQPVIAQRPPPTRGTPSEPPIANPTGVRTSESLALYRLIVDECENSARSITQVAANSSANPRTLHTGGRVDHQLWGVVTGPAAGARSR